MKIKLFACILLILLLAACGKTLTRGEVIDKDFRPAYSWIYMMPIPHTSCSGSPSVCTTTYTYIPVVQHEPDRWTITVEDCMQANDDGECPTDNWAVDETYFNNVGFGDTVTNPNGEE